MALNLQSSDDFASSTPNYRVFLYGDNRSGKTWFSGTWPNPVMIVHKYGTNEMRTLEGEGIPFVTYDSLDECLGQVKEVCAIAKRKSREFGYFPRTLVFDNLTTANEFWMEELEKKVGQKLKFAEWGELRAYVSAIMRELHSSPCHVIWIAHPRIEKVTETKGNHTEETVRASFSIKGASRDIIPGNCDWMLYSEVQDRGPQGHAYLMHLRKAGMWPAGVRLSRVMQAKVIGTIGPKPSPSYDAIAKMLGLPSRAEEEQRLADEWAAKFTKK